MGDKDCLSQVFRQLLILLGNAAPQAPARLMQVFRVQLCQVRSRADPSKATWGGRRRALMSYQEEQDFLAPWVEKAAAGGILVVSPLRAALAQKLGRKVAATVLYRMLARHGWRKVAPDTRHPKSDPAVQEAWKKNFRKRWFPC
jgi:transposase